MILGYPGMHGALVDTEIASGVGHGLIRLDGQFDCSLFELGTIRWGFVFAHGRGLTSLADTRLPNCPLQCSHFSVEEKDFVGAAAHLVGARAAATWRERECRPARV